MENNIRMLIANEIDKLRKHPSKKNLTSEKLDVLFSALIALNSIENKRLDYK